MSTPAQTAESPKKSGAAPRVVVALALLMGVLAVLLIVLGVVGFARVATPNMQGFNAGATVTLTDSGASIYARSDSERTATVCAATTDSTSTTLERPTSAFSVEVSQSEFFEVARTPDSLAAGSYSVNCEGTTSALYVGPSAPSTSASGLLGPAGLIAGVILAVIALGLGIVAVFLRNYGGGKKSAEATSGYGAALSGYSSPYASPPPPDSIGQQTPYGDQTQPGTYGQQPQNDTYRQSSDSRSFAPPPPPSWQSRQSEETQAIAYGQGHFDQPSQQGQSSGRPADVADHGDHDNAGQHNDIQLRDGHQNDGHQNDGHGSADRDSGDQQVCDNNGYPPPPPPPA